MRGRLPALGLLLAIVLACRAEPSPSPSASVSVWGEVPRQCTCHGEPTAQVASDLQDAKLPVEFKMEQATEGWQVFSVTFDPGRVSPDRVRQTLLDAGALVIPAPSGH
jgi:hypothetical protein